MRECHAQTYLNKRSIAVRPSKRALHSVNLRVRLTDARDKDWNIASEISLRGFFEVDRHHVAIAALDALARDGTLGSEVVAEALKRYRVNTDAIPPWEA